MARQQAEDTSDGDEKDVDEYEERLCAEALASFKQLHPKASESSGSLCPQPSRVLRRLTKSFQWRSERLVKPSGQRKFIERSRFENRSLSSFERNVKSLVLDIHDRTLDWSFDKVKAELRVSMDELIALRQFKTAYRVVEYMSFMYYGKKRTRSILKNFSLSAFADHVQKN